MKKAKNKSKIKKRQRQKARKKVEDREIGKTWAERNGRWSKR